jgi:hypothetical protein
MEDLIRKYVTLPTHPTARGWYSIKCLVCKDYKIRGGFRFADNITYYHCFNCAAKGSYDNDRKFLSEDMVKILDAFNIPNNEIDLIKFQSLGHTYIKKDKKTSDLVQNPIYEIPLLPHFYKLTNDNNDTWSIIAREYLQYDRGINWQDYPFFLSKGDKTKQGSQWIGRLIIPLYRRSRLIFYQGRDLVGTRKLKYKNAMLNNNSIILYGYDELYTATNDPLFIVEGFFDAFMINGIAIMGNELHKPKIDVINQSNRRKIYIPDLYGNGGEPALVAINAGWEVSIPDIGSCKDINEAITRFGKLYVLKSIMDNVLSGFSAKVAVTTLCK